MPWSPLALVTTTLALVGCYQSHEIEPPRDAGQDGAVILPDLSPPADLPEPCGRRVEAVLARFGGGHEYQPDDGIGAWLRIETVAGEVIERAARPDDEGRAEFCVPASVTGPLTLTGVFGGAPVGIVGVTDSRSTEFIRGGGPALELERRSVGSVEHPVVVERRAPGSTLVAEVDRFASHDYRYPPDTLFRCLSIPFDPDQRCVAYLTEWSAEGAPLGGRVLHWQDDDPEPVPMNTLGSRVAEASFRAPPPPPELGPDYAFEAFPVACREGKSKELPGAWDRVRCPRSGSATPTSRDESGAAGTIRYITDSSLQTNALFVRYTSADGTLEAVSYTPCCVEGGEHEAPSLPEGFDLDGSGLTRGSVAVAIDAPGYEHAFLAGTLGDGGVIFEYYGANPDGRLVLDGFPEGFLSTPEEMTRPFDEAWAGALTTVDGERWNRGRTVIGVRRRFAP